MKKMAWDSTTHHRVGLTEARMGDHVVYQGKSCPQGHDGTRYTKTHHCVACKQAYQHAGFRAGERQDHKLAIERLRDALELKRLENSCK